MGFFFKTLCRDHFTPTLGQNLTLSVASSSMSMMVPPLIGWFSLSLLLRLLLAVSTKITMLQENTFLFFFTFLYHTSEFQKHFGTFQCLITYIVWRVEPPVYWFLGEGLPCPGSNHHPCLPYSASSWNSPVLQVFLC